jgi:hypothetical protein
VLTAPSDRKWKREAAARETEERAKKEAAKAHAPRRAPAVHIDLTAFIVPDDEEDADFTISDAEELIPVAPRRQPRRTAGGA